MPDQQSCSNLVMLSQKRHVCLCMFVPRVSWSKCCRVIASTLSYILAQFYIELFLFMTFWSHGKQELFTNSCRLESHKIFMQRDLSLEKIVYLHWDKIINVKKWSEKKMHIQRCCFNWNVTYHERICVRKPHKRKIIHLLGIILQIIAAHENNRKNTLNFFVSTNPMHQFAVIHIKSQQSFLQQSLSNKANPIPSSIAIKPLNEPCAFKQFTSSVIKSASWTISSQKYSSSKPLRGAFLRWQFSASVYIRPSSSWGLSTICSSTRSWLQQFRVPRRLFVESARRGFELLFYQITLCEHKTILSGWCGIWAKKNDKTVLLFLALFSLKTFADLTHNEI